MGCNACKGGRAKPLNNVNNQDTLKIVKEIYDNVVQGNDTDKMTDLDKLEVINAYNMLYPNASGIPSIDEAIKKITEALQFLKVPNQKIKR